jgi:hypothetical protein
VVNVHIWWNENCLKEWIKKHVGNSRKIDWIIVTVSEAEYEWLKKRDKKSFVHESMNLPDWKFGN